MSYNNGVREKCSGCQTLRWSVGVYKEMTSLCVNCYQAALIQNGHTYDTASRMCTTRTFIDVAQKTPPSSGAPFYGTQTTFTYPPGNTPLVGRPPKEHCKHWCNWCTAIGRQCMSCSADAAASLPQNTPLGVRRHARRVISDDGAFIFLVLLAVAGLTVTALLLAGVIH